MIENLSVTKCAILVSAVIYALYLWLYECRQIADERREMIRLRALRAGQKVTTAVLLALALINCFWNVLDSQAVLAIAIMVALYSEIFFKLIVERRM